VIHTVPSTTKEGSGCPLETDYAWAIAAAECARAVGLPTPLKEIEAV
jgi:hypothetical protein